MTDREDAARDVTLTYELMLNERIVTHPTYGEIILHRPTPRMEFAVGEMRGRQYQKDLRDETILSRAELEKLAIRRGIWDKADSERSLQLQSEIGQIMALLDNVGYKSLDVVLGEYTIALQALMDSFEEHDNKEMVTGAIQRYFDLQNESPEKADHSLIFKNAPNSDVEEQLDKARLLRTQIKLLEQLQKARQELEPLLIESARLFKDSIEMRADRTEALAKLYHCVTTRKGQPLWKSFDALMDEKPRDLELLMEEMYFFERGIPDRDRNILGRHGFTMRAPTENSFDDSPGSPQPSSNGESQPSEPISSGSSME